MNADILHLRYSVLLTRQSFLACANFQAAYLLSVHAFGVLQLEEW